MLGMVDKGQAKLAEDLTTEKDLVRQLQEQVKQLVDAQKAPDAPDQQLDHGVGTDLAYSTNLKDFVEHLEGMPGSLLLKKVGPMEVTEKAVTTWFKTMKLSSAKRTRVNKASEHFRALAERVPGAVKTQMTGLCAKFGLSTTKLGSMNAKPAIDILIMATYLME